MIDTDKYEGHTEGPWKPFRFDNMIWTVGNLTVEWKEADKNLVADAPLLLAEVKRLREENDMLSEAVKEDNDILKKHIETLEEVKRLRKELTKANKYVHTICQHSDSMLMDYEDYMNGDEEE